MSDNPTSVALSFDFTNADERVSAAGCWPDGEPETWTARDVAQFIEDNYSGIEEFLNDWGLDRSCHVTVVDSNGQCATAVI